MCLLCINIKFPASRVPLLTFHVETITDIATAKSTFTSLIVVEQ
jgi:hypothetical protein